jgi:hypothetical protein
VLPGCTITARRGLGVAGARRRNGAAMRKFAGSREGKNLLAAAATSDLSLSE